MNIRSSVAEMIKHFEKEGKDLRGRNFLEAICFSEEPQADKPVVNNTNIPINTEVLEQRLVPEIMLQPKR